MAADERAPEGVTRVRADNPSPLTLDGTNTYVVGAWVVDPGPADERHVEAVVRAAGEVVEGIALTHGHGDHADGVEPLRRLVGDPPVWRPRGGERRGPFEAIATPGHSPDSVCLVAARVCFTGDTVLGTGSVFIAPGEGSLGAYLASLERLRALELDVICPGHGPFVWDPPAKLDEYIAHRLDRERRLVAALEAGARSEDEMLDAAWDDVPDALRFAAAITMRAHLEKLAEEGRLPDGLDAAAGT